MASAARSGRRISAGRFGLPGASTWPMSGSTLTTSGMCKPRSSAGRRLADELREELDDFEMRASGGMIYFIDERQLPLFRSFVAERRAAGLPMELIDGKAAREHCPMLSDKVIGASWNPLDAHQNTAKLVEALVAAAK